MPINPLAKTAAARLARLNDAIREISARRGTFLVELDAHAVSSDRRLWNEDRLHANPEGHRRIAAAAAHAIGLPDTDMSWTAAFGSPRRPALAPLARRLVRALLHAVADPPRCADAPRATGAWPSARSSSRSAADPARPDSSRADLPRRVKLQGMNGGIEVRDLTVRRGDRVVLSDVSFAAPRGQVLALVGPSGAGKSTLLRCLTRLAEPESGTIGLDGEDIRRVAPQVLRRRVALVAQAPVMLPGTVADNLAYGLPALADDARDAALAAAGFDDSFLPRVAKALSGGERARVALARALTREPDAILLDEPTAALDPDTARVIAADRRRARAAGPGRDRRHARHALAEAVSDATLRVCAESGAAGGLQPAAARRVAAAWPRSCRSRGHRVRRARGRARVAARARADAARS